MQASLIIDKLKRNGVTHVVGLPDNGSRTLFEQLWADDELPVIPVTREGEAFSVASGLWLGGANPVVIIQNTGFLETGDAFRGTCYNMGCPIVAIMGYRGFATMEPDAPRVDTAATFLEPTLKAWDIPYGVMHSEDDMHMIDDAFEQARQRSKPAAVLFVPHTS